MVLLSRLLKNVEDYYQQALKLSRLTSKAQAGWSMPDDPEPEEDDGDGEEMKNPPHFDELMDISHQVDDPGLAQQLQILAELYKRTIQIGGGYATIAQAINNLKNEYSDGSESDIEGILNGMIKELAKHAGGVAALAGKDNPRFTQQLFQLRQDILARNQDKQSEALDAYNEEVNVPGADSEDESDYTNSGLGTEEGEVVFDPTAGIGGGKDGPAVNRGWHTTGKAGAYKNWSEYYDNERQAYEADLAQEKNPSTANILKQLIELLGTLSTKTAEALKLSDDLKVAPDPAGTARLQTMREDLSKMKKAKTMLKSKIRTNQLAKEQQKLALEIAGTRDVKEQELLKQKMALNELSQSTDIYKTKERNYRQKLIDSMSGGNFPGPDTLKDMLSKIQEASTKRVSLEAYRKQQVDKLKQQFQYTEAGNRRIAPISVEGIITQFKQSLPSIKMGIKKNITEKLMLAEDIRYKPYKDACNAAAATGNAVKIAEAKKAFQKIVNADAENDPLIRQFVAYGESFYKYIKEVESLQKVESTESANGKTLLKTAPPETIQKLIDEGKGLLMQEINRSRKGKLSDKPSKLELALKEIVTQLEQRMQAISGKLSAQGYVMNRKQRMAALKAHMKKQAQQSTDVNNYAEVAENAPEEQLAPVQVQSKDFGHEVFMEILSNLKIKGLDY